MLLRDKSLSYDFSFVRHYNVQLYLMQMEVIFEIASNFVVGLTKK